MKKSIFFILALIATTHINAQMSGQLANYNSTEGDGGASSAMTRYATRTLSDEYTNNDFLKNGNIKGSPYTSNSFSPTTLYLKDEKIGDIYYRYNALNEEVEIKKIYVFIDVNGDGFEDAVLAGNIYETEVETPRLDAFSGLILVSNGSNGYLPMTPIKAGTLMKGNIKDLMLMEIQGQKGLWATQNNGEILFFKKAGR